MLCEVVVSVRTAVSIIRQLEQPLFFHFIENRAKVYKIQNVSEVVVCRRVKFFV